MEHTKHLWRAVLALLAVTIAVTLGRRFLVPDSFGKLGFYRADNLEEQMARPIHHGGRASCQACHEDEYDEHQEGKHAVVQCEVCHDALASHVRDGERVADMPTRKSWRLCVLCHGRLAARPDSIPQIDLREHLTERGAVKPDAPIPEAACRECHPPHDPMEQ